jgi:phosphoglycolate phosphatase-like HAD superfamily hydrolase
VAPALHRLILWDIDGTLTYSGSSATEVFEHAVDRALGRCPEPGTISFSGKTDRAIAEEFLRACGRTDHALTEVILADIETGLAERAARIAAEGNVHPGVREVILALRSRSGVAQSVLTGNIPANARVKLAAFGLDTLLDLDAGAYGRDLVDRALLLPRAWENQQRLHGRTFSPAETWVIGDTPRDLACARAGGAHCLLVGTGNFPASELSGLGADAVFPDLADTAAVVATLTEVVEHAPHR